jgi:hypothetical protein
MAVNNYVLNTSYGQGTDLLSLKQYHVLLAWKGFGLARHIHTLSGLIDVAPTILNILHLPALNKVDGISLVPDLIGRQPPYSKPRPLFMETGDSMADIETDHLFVEKIVKHQIGAYRINPKNGLLSLKAHAERLIIAGKQRSILLGNWLLARYPSRLYSKLVPAISHGKQALVFQSDTIPPYFVLVNLLNGQWTMDWSSSLAKLAPLSVLMRNFYEFYGDDLS